VQVALCLILFFAIVCFHAQFLVPLRQVGEPPLFHSSVLLALLFALCGIEKTTFAGNFASLNISSAIVWVTRPSRGDFATSFHWQHC